MALRLFDDDKAKEIYLATCAAYRRGGGQKEVAERYGCNPKTISDLFCHRKPYSFLATICQRCGERRWEIVMHQTEERVCWGCMLVVRKEGALL